MMNRKILVEDLKNYYSNKIEFSNELYFKSNEYANFMSKTRLSYEKNLTQWEFLKSKLRKPYWDSSFYNRQSFSLFNHFEEDEYYRKQQILFVSLLLPVFHVGFYNFDFKNKIYEFVSDCSDVDILSDVKRQFLEFEFIKHQLLNETLNEEFPLQNNFTIFNGVFGTVPYL